MKLQEVVARDPLDRLQRATRPPAIRMVRVQSAHQHVDGDRAGVVFVLEDGGQQLRPASLHFVRADERTPDNVSDEGKDRVEVLRETGRADRQLMPAGHHRQ